jgi:AcrR family transcriptional regulator
MSSLSVQGSPAPRALSVATIVQAAAEIADADGLAAVSMRSVAARLGVAAMSLYRHVASKETLLELMADHILADLPHPNVDARWQEEMRGFWIAFRRLLLEHPAVAQVMLELPIAGPELSLRGEAVLACLVHGGLDDGSAVQALTSMEWYTIGAALHAIASTGTGAEAEARGSGWEARLRQLSADRFPTVRRLAKQLDRDATEEHFVRGLERLIRGYED